MIYENDVPVLGRVRKHLKRVVRLKRLTVNTQGLLVGLIIIVKFKVQVTMILVTGHGITHIDAHMHHCNIDSS